MDHKVVEISLGSYEAITNVRSFGSYDEGEAQVGDHTSADYRIAGAPLEWPRASWRRVEKNC